MKTGFGSAALFLAATAWGQDDLGSVLKPVADVYAVLAAEGADPVDSAMAFYGGAIPGMLRRLDPHSVFLDPAQFEQLKQLQDSKQKGFGSVVSVLPGRVIFLQTLPGTPSAKAGLAPGDEIVSINGYLIERFEMEQIVALLSQARQAPAKVEIRRPGAPRLLDMTLTPEEMLSPSVERAFLLDGGFGYVRVASFDEKTAEQVKEAIEKLGGSQLKGLVIDLRNNPGGLLPSALKMSAMFLKPGQKILSVRGRRVPEKDQTVPEGSQPYEFPLAVLINEKSASASEIVAGAMQDHDRGTIVGTASYGKGLVESVYPLSDSAGIALTTALYYTPSGRSIQRPLTDSGFALATTAAKPNERDEFKTDSGRIVKGGGGIQPDFVVLPEGSNPLRAVIEATGSFTNFATDYVRDHKAEMTPSFRVTPALLDDFRVFLTQRKIQPGVSEWSREREFLQSRLEQEIVNQAFGVERGDEVEARRDPVIRRAVESLVR